MIKATVQLYLGNEEQLWEVELSEGMSRMEALEVFATNLRTSIVPNSKLLSYTVTEKRTYNVGD
jgi:hypothetical protein